MTFGEGTYKGGKDKPKEEKTEDLKIGFIETNNTKGKPAKPVVIPSAVNSNGVKKLNTKKEEENTDTPKNMSIDDMFLNEEVSDVENKSNVETEGTEEPVKKKRGRPRKVIEPGTEPEVKVPKKRGRPKKVTESEDKPLENQESILPGFDSRRRERFTRIKKRRASKLI